MGKTATLAVRITADSRDARKGFNQATQDVEQFQSRFQRVNNRMQSLAVPAAAVAAAIGGIGKKAYDSASALQQSTGAAEAVFKQHSNQVKGYADGAAQNLGLAKSQYQQMAAVMGSQLKNMGVSQKDLAGQTNQLIQTGADLAAQFGGDTSQAVEALSAALRGERDPIERYGISIKEADIKAQKAAMGLAGLTGEADKNATAQATLALIAKQSADAQGAFAREANTSAGQAQRARAEYENMKAALGEALLPAVTVAMKGLGALARFVGANANVFAPLIAATGAAAASVIAWNTAMRAVNATRTMIAGVRTAIEVLGRLRDGYQSAAAAQSAFSGLAGTIGGRLRAVTDAMAAGAKAATAWAAAQARAAATAVASAAKSAAAWVASCARTIASLTAQAAALVAQKAAQIAAAAATALITAAQWLWNIAMTANPIGLIIVAIGLLVIALAALIIKWDVAREAATKLWQSITAGAAAAWNAIKSGVQNIGATIIGFHQRIREAATGLIASVVATGTGMLRSVTNQISGVLTWISTIPERIGSMIRTVTNWVTTLTTVMHNAVIGRIRSIIAWFEAIPAKIKNAFNFQPPSWFTRATSFRFSAPTVPGTLTAATWNGNRNYSPIGTPSDGPQSGSLTINLNGTVIDERAIDELVSRINTRLRARGTTPGNERYIR